MRLIVFLLFLHCAALAEPRLPDIARDLGDVTVTAPANIAPDNSPVIGGIPGIDIRKYLTLQVDSKHRVRVLWSRTLVSGTRDRVIIPEPIPLINGKSYQFTVAGFVDSRGFYRFYVKTIADGAKILLNTLPIEFDRLDAEIVP